MPEPMRPLSASEKFHTYMSGWKAGAGGRSREEKYMTHHREEFRKIYLDGFKEGEERFHLTRRVAMGLFDYAPVVLRNVFDE